MVVTDIGGRPVFGQRRRPWGSVLARFQMPSSAFHTAEVLPSDSLSTVRCSGCGQPRLVTLLAIHTAAGGSMNSRFGQRQLPPCVAASSISSMPVTDSGCIGPTITTASWARSISTTGTAALSPMPLGTSA